MTKRYASFKEIEDDIKTLAPPVVYKYRSWENDSQKSLLKGHQIWFPHPFHLNDPLDARPPYAFDITEINSDAYYQKLLASVPRDGIGDNNR